MGSSTLYDFLKEIGTTCICVYTCEIMSLVDDNNYIVVGEGDGGNNDDAAEGQVTASAAKTDDDDDDDDWFVQNVYRSGIYYSKLQKRIWHIQTSVNMTHACAIYGPTLFVHCFFFFYKKHQA